MRPSWLLRVLAAVPSGAVAALAALALGGCSHAPPPPAYHGIVLTPPAGKPDFRLTATDGQPYDFRQATEGKLTFLYFGYTYCPDVCPVHLANIEAAVSKLSPSDRDRVRVVFVTTDPDRDTPARLRTWLNNFDTAFVGLRGTEAEVNTIQGTLSLPSSVKSTAAPHDTTYEVGHSALVLAFTPDDSLRVMYPFGVKKEDWAADVPVLLSVKPAR